MQPNTVLSVALVDDDEAILETLSAYLDLRGCNVRTARSGAELDTLLAHETFDVIVLDVMMPGEDGLAICRRLSPHHPIIMLSAMGEVSDRVIGLELGAWDYLAKPFDPRELLARIRSLARRPVIVAERAKQQAFSFDGWVVDVDALTLLNPAGDVVALSGSEWSVLQAFLNRPQRVLTRDMLLTDVHGPVPDVYDRAIDVAVSRLRRKLLWSEQPSPIVTVRGEGYRFMPAVKRLA